MSLTGQALPWLLGLLAVVFFALLVLGWPHLRRRWQRMLSRAVMVVLLNMTVLLLTGVYLNNEYEFYSSWGDLLGEQAAAALPHHTGASAARAVKSELGPSPQSRISAPTQLPPLPSTGRLQRFRVSGQRSHVTNTVLVYLPKGYDPAKPRRYPVLEGFHGYPGHAGFYLHLSSDVDFLGVLDEAIAQRKLAESIVVLPEISMDGNVDTECVNDPHGQQTETWLAEDVPSWVMTHFRAQSARTSWATMGFSMGGWCAIELAALHPQTYSNAISWQGYFRPIFDPSNVPFAANSDLGQRYDVLKLLHDNPPPIAIWSLASKPDNISYPTSSEALKSVRAPTSLTSTLLATGGHRVGVWGPRISTAFAWLGKTAPGFKPPPGAKVKRVLPGKMAAETLPTGPAKHKVASAAVISRPLANARTTSR